MTTPTITASQIRRRRRVGQIAAVVFLGAATGVIVFGLPGTEVRPISTNPRPDRPAPAPGDATADTAQAPPVDYAWLADRLSSVGGVVPPPEPETPIDPVERAETDPQRPVTTPSTIEVRYLGSIVEPRRRLALLTIDGVQRLLSEGEQAEGVELVEVGPDYATVLVENEDAERTIDRAGRRGSVVTEVKTGVGGQPVENANPLDPRNRPTRRPADRRGSANQ